MPALHELLAVEKTRTSQAVKLLKETLAKFQKASQYFQGYEKSLKMIVDSAENTAIESAARESAALPTTERVLQYRQEVMNWTVPGSNPLPEWSDWQDVPLVREE